jgi:hypothetical protein
MFSLKGLNGVTCQLLYQNSSVENSVKEIEKGKRNIKTKKNKRKGHHLDEETRW